jgi:hypothetical protein
VSRAAQPQAVLTDTVSMSRPESQSRSSAWLSFQFCIPGMSVRGDARSQCVNSQLFATRSEWEVLLARATRRVEAFATSC